MSHDVLNIVVPMAGRGSRFVDAGFDLPKPLLDVRGRAMIEVVVDNLRPSCPHRFIFICQREHLERYALAERLESVCDDLEIISIERVTEGAACTVMLSENLINNDQPLMIANCDQYVSVSMDDYLGSMQKGNFDGYIMTMAASDPKWSYIRLDEHDKICEVIEKQVVSTEATVGIYNYRSGAEFVYAAQSMIANGDRVNGEFYVAPVYNYMIRAGANIGFYNIGSDRSGMYGLGVPEDLEYFNALPSFPM